MKVIIIGGVAGGASCAARLRRMDEHADIIMVERGPFISYANCGLPYYIGGEIEDQGELELQTPESFNARFNVDVRVNTEAVAIDREAKTITLRTADGSVTESYDRLVLAPGAEPFRPGIPGLDLPGVFTLRTIPDTLAIKQYIAEKAPRRALIIGGGFIGIEMAENLARAGLSVTLAEAADQVVAPLDGDMAWELHQHLSRSGVDLKLSCTVLGIHPADMGLQAEIVGGSIQADLIILAIGVRPESGLARAAGIETDERGFIITDARMATSDPSIYAVGDAVQITHLVSGEKSAIPLAGPANKQGRIAADNIAGHAAQFKGAQGSSVLRAFGLTVATTGLNEKTARRLDIPYGKTFVHTANHARYYPGATNMSIKALYDPASGRMLGAQIIGFDGVDKRCDILATAIRAGLTAEQLCELELCYAPPYGSAKDPINMVGFTIENERQGLVRSFHWHEVQALSPADCTLLDVRTRVEYNRGYISGFINIPLDDLRGRLGELDRKKPVYVTCQVGLRGYVAARILSQHGFEVYNLNGGYRLYSGMEGRK